MTEETDRGSDGSPVGARHIGLAVGASIGGLLVHNLAEFPPQILFAPETLVPVALTVLVGVAMRRRPTRSVFLVAAVWALIVFVFGGGSVLPLNVLPFVPEQTLGHYAAHAVYALAQLPLLWVAWQGIRAPPSSD